MKHFHRYAPALVTLLSLTSYSEAISTYSAPRTVTDRTIQSVVDYELERLGSRANLNHLDVSQVTIMSELFAHKKFNGDISQWNVRKVKDMSGMFRSSTFNGDISQWDVRVDADVTGMFSASSFDGDISEWYLSENRLKKSGYPNVFERFIRTPTAWGVDYGIVAAGAGIALVMLYLFYIMILRRTLRIYFEEKSRS